MICQNIKKFLSVVLGTVERQNTNSKFPKRRKTMKSLLKPIALTGLFWLLFALPTAAQITTKLVFETSFPFYAGNAKMPAGTYTVTQGDSDEPVLQIENATGTHTAFLDYIPTTGESPHPQTDVTFNKYGKVDFLNLLWV
jgi:hypothetical protein